MGPPARVVVRVVEVPPFAPATVWHDIGIFVRSRESQLRFCYVEMGLKLDPALTGQVTATMALRQDGRVEAVALEPAPGGWHGPAADGVQACVRNRIRSWRFPAGIAGSHRVALDFRLDPLAR